MSKQQPSAEKIGNPDGTIGRELLFFFFPILFGTFFQQLYNTADAVIVGRWVGKEALAAVGGSTSVLITFLVNLLVGVSSGATVIIAQYYGACRDDDVSRSVHTSIALALTGGVGMMILSMGIAPFCLRAMGLPPEIMGDALLYLRVYLLGLVPAFLYNVGAGILRALGETRRPLYYLIVACMTNIVLDVVFVVGLHMGVFGVAAATLISQIVSAALMILALRQPGTLYHLRWREIRFTPHILKSIIRVGIPAGLQSDMYSISNIIIQSCVNSFGTNTIAAWTAYGKIDGFFWMIMGAYGVSITTFVGQNFGAGRYDRIRRSVRVSMKMTLGTSLLMSTLLCVFGRGLLGLFCADPQVLEIGSRMLWFMAPFYFTYICVEVLSATIRGIGNALTPMLITGGGICVMRILWVLFILPLHRTMETVAISYPLSWALTSLFFILYYLRGRWMPEFAR